MLLILSLLESKSSKIDVLYLNGLTLLDARWLVSLNFEHILFQNRLNEFEFVARLVNKIVAHVPEGKSLYFEEEGIGW